MAKSKLRAALDAHKGVDYKQQKDKKKQKAGEKRHKAKVAKSAPQDSDAEEEEEEGGVLIDEEAVGTEIDKTEEQKLQAELKALLGDKKRLMEIDSGSDVDEDEDEDEDEGNGEDWESAAEDMEDEEEGSEDEEQGINLSRLADSESDSDSDDDVEMSTATKAKPTPKANGAAKTNGASKPAKTNGAAAAAEDDDDEGSDIPLSDIEDLDDEERGDIIPHQRLTINNKPALLAAYTRIALPLSTMAFSQHQVVTSATNTANAIEDIEDDLKRELALYAQSLDAVKKARKSLQKEGVPFTRPTDYFAEMVKSDEHMGKVKDKLRDEAASKKASAEARRQRDLKKFGKQVQVAKIQERAKEKRETLDKINVLKRKRSGALPEAETEPDLFDVGLEDSATTAKKDREARKERTSGGRKGPHADKGRDRDDREGGDRNAKRQKKDSKYGYGGKKRFAKSGNEESTNDMRGFPGKGMKKPFKGIRPGKSKRAKGRA